MSSVVIDKIDHFGIIVGYHLCNFDLTAPTQNEIDLRNAKRI